MTENLKIRKAQPTDLSQILDLCHAHALYEKAPYNKEGKAERLSAHLFSAKPKLSCLVVAKENTLIGYASLVKQFSTWDADFYMYLDCLFIQERYRGLGLGQKMMQAIQQEALNRGCNSIQWQTPDFNHPAIQFYQRLGASSKSKERFFWNLV